MTGDPQTTRAARWWSLVLAAIVVGAFALRVDRLGEVPAGLFCDEAANGYNAYSLLETGHDEHAKTLPLFVWSFFAFKYPLYIYPSIPWVGLFGLTEFSARLQAALYGTATVLVAFLIARRLFGVVAGLAAAAVLAVLPWHLHFSRIGFALIGFPFWFGLGFYFFVRALGEDARRRDWLLAAACFALCLYVYAVAQLVIPIFMILAVLLYAPAVWRRRRWAVQAAALGIVVAVPFLIFYARHADRASVYVMQTSLLARPGPLADKLELILRDNWPTYFGNRFLFEMGDPILRHGVPRHGVLYWSLAPWIGIGIAGALLTGRRGSALLVLWLLLYPLGAAVTRETPSATRSILGSLVFALLAGGGFDRAVQLLLRLPLRPLRWCAVGAVTLVAMVTVGREANAYVRHYFTEYRVRAAKGIEGFQYGYRDLYRIMEERRRPGDRLLYSTTSVNNPYIFYLFYVRRPPARTSEWGSAEIDYVPVRLTDLDRWYDPQRRTLLAALPEDMWFFQSWDDRVDVLAPDGTAAFVVLENPKPKEFVETWHILGPFGNPQNRNRLHEFVDPSSLRVNEATLSGARDWEPYRARGGVVELNRYLARRVPGAGNNPEFVIAYLRAALRSPDARKVLLELVGSRDQMIVWLNGERAGDGPIDLTESELRTLELDLRQGDNTVLVKTIETVGDWWFAAHLADPDGRPAEAVSVVEPGR